MKTFLDSENSEVRIEIIPLIDVIFCILTFFILAAVGLTRPEGINLDLPKAQTGMPQFGAILQVKIDELGQLYVDKQPVDQAQLTQTLKTYVRAQPAGVIVLSADKFVSYAQVIQVLDLLQSVGGNRVALGTTTPTEGSQQVPPAPFQNPDPLQLPPLTSPNGASVGPQDAQTPAVPARPRPNSPQRTDGLETPEPTLNDGREDPPGGSVAPPQP